LRGIGRCDCVDGWRVNWDALKNSDLKRGVGRLRQGRVRGGPRRNRKWS
jgi:hypothetical protein